MVGCDLLAGVRLRAGVTHDSTSLRLYVNGSLVTTTAAAGAISVSAGALRIGANTIWPEEAFQGLIDEVRIYNRALTLAELTTDMNTPLGAADTAAPTKPTGFVSTGSTATSIATGWTASTDSVGVAGYRLFLDGTQAGTTAANDVHLHRPDLLELAHPWRRGLRSRRQHLGARHARRDRGRLRHHTADGRDHRPCSGRDRERIDLR